jgi:hypothetical protein
MSLDSMQSMSMIDNKYFSQSTFLMYSNKHFHYLGSYQYKRGPQGPQQISLLSLFVVLTHNEGSEAFDSKL